MKKTIIIILMLLLVTIAAFGCMKKDKVEENLTAEAVNKSSVSNETLSGVKTYCIFGSDARPNDENGRSDVMMLVRIDNENQDIKIVSVYRDTLMDIGGLAKCNAAFEYGGPFYSMDMLERNLDLDIDGYIAVDFLSAINVIDSVGGVDLEITDEEARFANGYIKSMNKAYDRDSAMLKGGENHLDGVQAVGYARVRYTEGWDYKRTERQRTILSLVIDKLRDADEDSKSKALETILKNVQTNMSGNVINETSNKLLTYKMDGSEGFPKYKKGATISGLGSCVIPDDLAKNVKWLHEYLYGDSDYTPSEDVISINQKILDIQ